MDTINYKNINFPYQLDIIIKKLLNDIYLPNDLINMIKYFSLLIFKNKLVNIFEKELINEVKLYEIYNSTNIVNYISFLHFKFYKSESILNKYYCDYCKNYSFRLIQNEKNLRGNICQSCYLK